MPNETPDVEVTTDGPGVYLFSLLTQPARDWVDENVDTEGYMWLGDRSFACFDSGLAHGITQGMQEAGLVVQ